MGCVVTFIAQDPERIVMQFAVSEGVDLQKAHKDNVRVKIGDEYLDKELDLIEGSERTIRFKKPRRAANQLGYQVIFMTSMTPEDASQLRVPRWKLLCVSFR